MVTMDHAGRGEFQHPRPPPGRGACRGHCRRPQPRRERPATVHPPRSLAVLLAVLLAGCGAEPAIERLNGRTMGTTWSVQWRGEAEPQALRAAIEQRLAALNAQMSTWDPDSVLSRFNAGPAGRWWPLPPELAEVLAAALAIGRASGGALDVTVGPLVRLWGFGPDGRIAAPPGRQAIAAARAATGLDLIELRRSPPALRKHDPATEVDLSAIAKGYAVDALAGLLAARGLEAYLVEIGGEVRAAGSKPGGEPWRVAIEQPRPGGAGAAPRVVPLTGGAVATSGGYRNFFEAGGRRYSHTIDPATGRPVDHDLAAVSVLAETCMRADAWATALLVQGPAAGPRTAERLGLAALFMIRRDGAIITRASPALQSALSHGDR